MNMKMKLAADLDGHLTALDSEIVIDGGAYSSFGVVTTYYSGQLISAPTHVDAYRFKSQRYFTNKPRADRNEDMGQFNLDLPLKFNWTRWLVHSICAQSSCGAAMIWDQTQSPITVSVLAPTAFWHAWMQWKRRVVGQVVGINSLLVMGSAWLEVCTFQGRRIRSWVKVCRSRSSRFALIEWD